MIDINLKSYKFKTKDDFYFYLRHLIIGISKNLKEYERHLYELMSFIEDRNLIERPKRVVSYDVYSNHSDKIGYVSNYLLNLFGDQAEYGCSYQNYRRNVKKHGSKQGISFIELSIEQEEELNELTTSRNWASHVPVSLIHSTLEKAFAVSVDFTKPIYTANFEKYMGAWLVSLYDQNIQNLHGFKELFKLIQNDYTALTGVPCQIIENIYPVRDISDLKIPEISAGIQLKKIRTIEDIQKAYKKQE